MDDEELMMTSPVPFLSLTSLRDTLCSDRHALYCISFSFIHSHTQTHILTHTHTHKHTNTQTLTLTLTHTNTPCLSVSLSPSHPNHHTYSQSFRDSGVKKESSATPMAFFASTIIGQKQRNIIIPRNRGPYGVVYTLDFPGSAM